MATKTMTLSPDTTGDKILDRYHEKWTDPRDDVEALLGEEATQETCSYISKLLLLGVWLLLNLVLTIFNKKILSIASLPWLLTAVHAFSTTIGCLTVSGLQSQRLTTLSGHANLLLAGFSVLFTVNIVVSNISLSMVSVPLHQVLRSTCPLATLLLERSLGKSYSTATYISMIPLIVGVCLATIGDYHCTLAGLFMTILGVFLAALKTVSTNRILTGPLKLPTTELLLRMSSLATVQCIVCAYLDGEIPRAYSAYVAGDLSTEFGLALLSNGTLACLLNGVSFIANKHSGALSMTVAGNIKQSLTILLGMLIFHVQSGIMNASGICITMAGAAWYSRVEILSKKAIYT